MPASTQASPSPRHPMNRFKKPRTPPAPSEPRERPSQFFMGA